MEARRTRGQVILDLALQKVRKLKQGLGLGQVPSGSKAQRKPTTFPLEPEANSKEIQRRKELSEWPGGLTSRSSTGLGLGQVPSGSKAQRKPTTFPLEPESNSKGIRRRRSCQNGQEVHLQEVQIPVLSLTFLSLTFLSLNLQRGHRHGNRNVLEKVGLTHLHVQTSKWTALELAVQLMS
eukprot:XP_011662379.1 PREDICTED: uncharacterized protein LOC105437468 [Strongylocentrotus purpuratus]